MIDSRTPTSSASGRVRDSKLVIGAAALGTAFEWYDFFLYGTLATVLAAKFFPPHDPTSALLAALATFGAGFVVRPLGGVLFGALGDRMGRKRTFLVTIVLMGAATIAIGLLPPYASIGLWAPALLVALRLLQGLALGGEFGGAAIYIAEHAPDRSRGLYTSWLQASGIAGFLLSLGVVALCQGLLGGPEFERWGWRVPFLFSVVLLAISVYIRLMLEESPVFATLRASSRTARRPVRESLSSWPNVRLILAAALGVAAGMSVAFYTTQFSTLYFLQGPAGLERSTATRLIAIASLLSIPSLILFGWLSDRLGRKRLLLAGYLLLLLLLHPLFRVMTDGANPALLEALRAAPVTVAGRDCRLQPFASRQQSPCARTLAHLNARGVGFRRDAAPTGADVAVTIGSERIEGFAPAALDAALERAGYERRADPRRIDAVTVVAALLAMLVLTNLTYGQSAAILAELFPARIRYTSVAVAHNLGSAYFGGFAPFLSLYIAATSGLIFGGLLYPLAVLALALVVAAIWLPESRSLEIAR